MHIQNPTTQTRLAAAVAELAERQSAFEHALDAWQQFTSQTTRREHTAAALRMEAEQARKDCRQAMRSTLGIPTKAVRELKHKEMANLELAEETLKIAEEEKIQAEIQHEALFEQRKALAEARDALQRQYWDAVLDDHLPQWGEQLPVLTLLLTQAPPACIERVFGSADWHREEEQVHAVLKPGALQQTLCNASPAAPDDLLARLNQPLPPLATPPLQQHNVIARQRYQAQRDAQYQALINR